jgi:hypothetical protein
MNFPLLAFNQGILQLEDDDEDLTTCSPGALKKGGWYDGLFLVDSDGRSYKIKGARKLHRVGGLLLWMFNPRIRVELEVGEESTISLEDVKQRVRSNLRSWHGWESGGNEDEIRAEVDAATTFRELFEAVRDPAPEPARA